MVNQKEFPKLPIFSELLFQNQCILIFFHKEMQHKWIKPQNSSAFLTF